MSEFVVITGLSGAGRSQAADDLEDLGWFVIDNLPAALIPKVAELADAPGSTIDRVALVVGSRRLPRRPRAGAIAALRAARRAGPRMLFLDAATEVLVRRYEEHPPPPPAAGPRRGRRGGHRARAAAARAGEGRGRRRHRHQRPQRPPAPRPDRRPVRRGRHRRRDADHASMSFGYKHGLPARRRPRVRLPVPAQPALGRRAAAPDRPRRAGPRLRARPAPTPGVPRPARPACSSSCCPAYVAEGKAYLTIAVGCTGGRHRSVAIAEELADRLRGARASTATVIHRDIGEVTPRRAPRRRHRRRPRPGRDAPRRAPLGRRRSPRSCRRPTTAGRAAGCATALGVPAPGDLRRCLARSPTPTIACGRGVSSTASTPASSPATPSATSSSPA